MQRIPYTQQELSPWRVLGKKLTHGRNTAKNTLNHSTTLPRCMQHLMAPYPSQASSGHLATVLDFRSAKTVSAMRVLDSKLSLFPPTRGPRSDARTLHHKESTTHVIFRLTSPQIANSTAYRLPLTSPQTPTTRELLVDRALLPPTLYRDHAPPKTPLQRTRQDAVPSSNQKFNRLCGVPSNPDWIWKVAYAK